MALVYSNKGRDGTLVGWVTDDGEVYSAYGREGTLIGHVDEYGEIYDNGSPYPRCLARVNDDGWISENKGEYGSHIGDVDKYGTVKNTKGEWGTTVGRVEFGPGILSPYQRKLAGGAGYLLLLREQTRAHRTGGAVDYDYKVRIAKSKFDRYDKRVKMAGPLEMHIDKRVKVVGEFDPDYDLIILIEPPPALMCEMTVEVVNPEALPRDYPAFPGPGIPFDPILYPLEPRSPAPLPPPPGKPAGGSPKPRPAQQPPAAAASAPSPAAGLDVDSPFLKRARGLFGRVSQAQPAKAPAPVPSASTEAAPRQAAPTPVPIRRPPTPQITPSGPMYERLGGARGPRSIARRQDREPSPLRRALIPVAGIVLAVSVTLALTRTDLLGSNRPVTEPLTQQGVSLGPAETIEAATADPPYWRVTSGGSKVNLRDGPSRSASVVLELPDGEVITNLDEQLVADGLAWQRVAYGPIEGWIAAELIVPQYE